MSDILQLFHPVILRWFADRVGLPTPPQQLGWPHIAAGRSTLILAPTGSGKTLAAFLAAIDSVAKKLLEHPGERLGMHILYVSPLKALANDVQKNLVRPLSEMADVAARMKIFWPEISVGLRTGDTPAKERAALIKSPPHILITTPESLNLMLTSSARTTLRGVDYVIIDEVHALAGNKRGVFLSLLLERLEAERSRVSPQGRQRIAPGVYMKPEPVRPLVRVGLSATARPEDIIAQWLAGQDDQGHTRPIEIVHTGQRKRLDLAVECPFPPAWERSEEDGTSNNPFVARRVLQLIREHHATLVFANSRRLVERMTSMIHEELSGAGNQNEKIPAILPHHGSIDKQVRLQTEESLKKGRLNAVIATSSLELGIDVGALDLVVQLDSPGSVAAGLQRVGRAGHLEKATARGRLLARTLNDLPSLAAILPLMFRGEVEETRIIRNTLDVLAQQVVAACSVETWPRHDLFQLFRGSFCYRDLTETQFDTVIAMLSKKTDAALAVGLKPRISFDRVNDRLIALPASRKLATINGGVIADTGQFPVYLTGTEPGKNSSEDSGRKPVRIGELDEEFVFETREHDNIVLGSQIWEVTSITDDRVLVARSGSTGNIRMPFWRGENAPRTELLGRAIVQFNAECESRIKAGLDSAREWLMREHHFDDRAADALIDFYQRQMALAGLPTSQRIVVEHITDRVGEPMIVILCPLGRRVNHVLQLAFESAFAARKMPVQITHHDDGVLIRPPGKGFGHVPDNPFSWLRSDLLQDDVLQQLEGSSLFGLRFRQNAARALMLPRVSPTQRTPLWQQRLRARHLLAVVRQHRNFPVVVETYRECLQDVLHVDQAVELIRSIERGQVQISVTHANHASPMAHTLMGVFEGLFLYQGDSPLQGADPSATVDPVVLDQILNRRLQSSPDQKTQWQEQDIRLLQRRLSGDDYPARTAEELLERIDAYGPVPLGGPDDSAWHSWAVEDVSGMLHELMNQNRLVLVRWKKDETRWVATESLAVVLAAIDHVQLYTYHDDKKTKLLKNALPPALLVTDQDTHQARRLLIEQALKRTVLIRVQELEKNFSPFSRDVKKIIHELIHDGVIVSAGQNDDRVMLAEHADQLRMIALRRERQIASVTDLAGLQNHLLRWQDITEPRIGPDALEDALDRLSGLYAPFSTWQYDILPARVKDFMPAMLDGLVAQGFWVCVGHPEEGVTFVPRHMLANLQPIKNSPLSSDAQNVLDFLRAHGASFQVDLEIALPQLNHGASLALLELFEHRWISNDQLEPLLILKTQADHIQSAEQRLRHQSDTSELSHRYPARFDFRRRAMARRSSGTGMTLGGRWYVLPGAWTKMIESDATDLAQQAADRVERMLRRNGFACRELNVPDVDGSWRQCYQVLTRMEWAGAVRRGYFVEGISGSQFAAGGVDFWIPPQSEKHVIWMSMLDPANVYSHVQYSWPTIMNDAVRIPRMAGSWLALMAGRPVLAAVSWAQRLIPLTEDQSAINLAVSDVGKLLDRLPPEVARVLSIRHWGHDDIIGSPVEDLLRKAGFVRDPQGLKLYRQYS